MSCPETSVNTYSLGCVMSRKYKCCNCTAENTAKLLLHVSVRTEIELMVGISFFYITFVAQVFMLLSCLNTSLIIMILIIINMPFVL
jgi:hypothetical protein